MASFTTTINPSQGFHTLSKTVLSFHPSFNLAQCDLYLLYSLPPLLIIDPYELANRHASFTFRLWNNKDLEKPVFALDQQPTLLLLNIAKGNVNPSPDDGQLDLEVEVPMHLRYGELSFSDDTHQVERIDWPRAFCRYPSTPHIPHTHPNKPLPEPILGMLNNSEVTFLDIPPSPTVRSHYDIVRVPQGQKADLAFVETGTAVVVLICFAWILRTSFRVARKLQTASISKAE